jgi:hypothetical protein
MITFPALLVLSHANRIKPLIEIKKKKEKGKTHLEIEEEKRQYKDWAGYESSRPVATSTPRGA